MCTYNYKHNVIIMYGACIELNTLGDHKGNPLISLYFSLGPKLSMYLQVIFTGAPSLQINSELIVIIMHMNYI